MKILILILVFGANGDITKHATLGTAPNVATCMIAAGEFIDKHKHELKADEVPFPVCLDTEPMTQ